MQKPTITFTDNTFFEETKIVENSPTNINDGSLTKVELDRLMELRKAYKGGVEIPFEIQLAAYEKEGEQPYGIDIDFDSLDGIDTVVQWLKSVVPLETRKRNHGVGEGLDDPDAYAINLQRATVIYIKCITEKAQAEVNGNEDDIYLFFPAPDGAKVGRNGYIHLFPGYPDSPAGIFRGDGASFSVNEIAAFIGKHFPEVEDHVMDAFADV